MVYMEKVKSPKELKHGAVGAATNNEGSRTGDTFFTLVLFT